MAKKTKAPAKDDVFRVMPHNISSTPSVKVVGAAKAKAEVEPKPAAKKAKAKK